MRNDRHKNPPRDPNNNPEKTLTDVIAREAVQRNHEGKAPNPAENDDMEYLPDTNITDDSKSGSCMEVHGDEEWVRDYGEMREDNTWLRDIADLSDGHHMEGEDIIDHRSSHSRSRALTKTRENQRYRHSNYNSGWRLGHR